MVWEGRIGAIQHCLTQPIQAFIKHIPLLLPKVVESTPTQYWLSQTISTFQAQQITSDTPITDLFHSILAPRIFIQFDSLPSCVPSRPILTRLYSCCLTHHSHFNSVLLKELASFCLSHVDMDQLSEQSCDIRMLSHPDNISIYIDLLKG